MSDKKLIIGGLIAVAILLGVCAIFNIQIAL